MYKSTDYEHEQLSFINFNMACGMQLDMNNEWIRIAQQLPWKAWEALYVAIFPSNTGNVAKPCRMVLGSLILQMRLGFTDRELVGQLRQNPYYQYFIGLPSFQHTAPFTRTLLVEQQKSMYDNKTHSVDNRIVSISQPYVRPVVRGKAKAPDRIWRKASSQY